MKLGARNTAISKSPMLHDRSHTGKADGSVRPGGNPQFTRMPYKNLSHVLKTMRELAGQWKGKPFIRRNAVQITGGIPKDPRTGLPDRRDYNAIADAIYKWMKRNIAYVRDPDGIEYLQSPDKTLKYGYGDCDDHATLAAALLGSIGVPTRFVVVKANAQNPDAYSHVFLEYQADGQWHPFDTTLHTQAGDGLAESRVFGKKTMPLNDVANSRKKKGIPTQFLAA